MKKMYYLKNIKNNEKFDVIARSLEEAKKIASELLHINVNDIIERF